MKKMKMKLEELVAKAPLQLGAGFDKYNNEEEEYLYIQTTCQEEYDHLDVQVELYRKKKPTMSDVLAAKYALGLLAKEYGVDISWNYLGSKINQSV